MKEDQWMKVVVSFDKDGNKTESTEPMTEDEIKQVLQFQEFMFSSRRVINGWEIFGELPNGDSMCRDMKKNYIAKFALN